MVFQYGELPVHYVDRGEGAPILVLHGWMGSAESFSPLIRDLAPHGRIVALDFPGQGGKTPEPPSPYDVGEHAQLVRALLTSLGIERTSIVAHSFGGRVSLKLAAENPDAVDRMVLTGCAGLIPKKTFKGKLRGAIYRAARAAVDGPLGGMFNRRRLREALVNHFGSPDYRALSPSMRPLFNRVVTEDLSYCLGKISAPTILIYGTEDRETPMWMGEKMAREIKDAALIPFHGAGHFAYLDQYPEFLAIVKNFLIRRE